MLSTFGKALRKIRIEHEMNLGDIGDLLGCSAAFVSAIERGVKAVPPGFLSQLAIKLSLTNEEIRSLDSAAAKQTRDSISITLSNKSDRAKELAVAFARRFETLSEPEIAAMLTDLNKRK